LRRLVLLLIAGSAFAAAPVASVTSSSDFQLRDATVNTAGVSSWPIMAGDTMVAGTGSATIRFIDGTLVTLAPNSRVKVQEKNSDLSLQLVNGSMSFVLADSSALRIFSGNTPVQAQPGVATTASVGGSASNAIIISTHPAPPASPGLSRY
jgi:hypothetical protein